MYTEDKHCYMCKKVTFHKNGACDICWTKAEKERIDKWNAMSVDERLNDLREQIENIHPQRLC